MKPESTQSEQPFDLPPPAPEYSPNQGQEQEDLMSYGEASSNIALEQGITGIPNDNPMNTAFPVPPIPPADPSLTVPIMSPQHGTPLIADDADLIEKEWVDKAKQIVDRTKHDPYQQNKEINKVKADYLKKRYNKDITISDDN